MQRTALLIALAALCAAPTAAADVPAQVTVDSTATGSHTAGFNVSTSDGSTTVFVDDQSVSTGPVGTVPTPPDVVVDADTNEGSVHVFLNGEQVV